MLLKRELEKNVKQPADTPQYDTNTITTTVSLLYIIFQFLFF